MNIKLRGENKKDIRNQIHELESKGIAFIKCTSTKQIDPQFCRDGKVLEMTFKAENQFATISELNLNNESSLTKEVSKIVEDTQSNVKRMFNHICPSYSKLSKSTMRKETLIDYGFNYVYVNNGYKFVW